MTAVQPAPLCSVIIPSFDAAATIEASVRSACRQTISAIEIIVVDDGSRDHSATLIAAIAANDSRVRLIQQSNGGVSSARNAGIAAAKSRVIALLDSDDLWAVDHLQTHLRRLQNEPRLGVSYSAARFIDAQGAIIGQSRSKMDNLTPADLLLGNPTTTCSTLVVRRDVFKDIGLFRTNMRHNEDQEWLFRAALSGWRLSGDANARVDYRTSLGGLASDLEGMLRGFETMLVEARKLAPVLVARNAVRARANMQRYLARRAIRLGLPPHVARGYIVDALRTRPLLLLLEPRATLPTLLATLVPQALLSPVLNAVRPQTAPGCQ
jgi:glycosyltransferase involved in cell wall biosynthesis